jgi:hypothetical protein
MLGGPMMRVPQMFEQLNDRIGMLFGKVRSWPNFVDQFENQISTQS